LLEDRHRLLTLIVNKDIDDQNVTKIGDPVRYAYLQGIRGIEQQLESLGYTGPQIDVGSYAEKSFSDDDAEEQYQNWNPQP